MASSSASTHDKTQHSTGPLGDLTEEKTVLNEHRRKDLHRLGVHPIEALEFAVKELDIGILIETLMGLVPGLDLAVGTDEDENDQ
jgi:hypothetical protein